MTESSIKKHKILEKVILYVKNDQDDKDAESSNKDNIQYIKRDLKEVIDYYRNTTTYHSDGSIVITPYYLENIPNEILDKIIGYLCDQHQSQQHILQKSLYQLTLVNKQFYQCTNHLLWRAPSISNTDTVDRFLTCLTNTQIVQHRTNRSNGRNDSNHHPVPFDILTSKHHIRRLDIIGEVWENMQFSLMMPYLGFLETLIIRDDHHESKLPHELFRYLPRYCPYIITLSAAPTFIKHPSCLDTILQHCHQLGKLELYIDYLNKESIGCILKSLVSCPSLTILNLHFTFEQDGISFLTKDMILHITKLHRLTGLALIGTNNPITMDLFFRTIHIDTAWLLLTSLRLDKAIPLDDSLMFRFISSHPHIQSLDLGATVFSNITLDRIPSRLTHITHVRLIKNDVITSSRVYNLIRRCRYLQQADFSWCKKVIQYMNEFSGLESNEPAILTLAQMKKIRPR